MTGRQLNIRLDPSDREKLEALAYVRRTVSASLAREIVLEYVSVHQHDPGVQTALAGRAQHDRAVESPLAGVAKLRRRR